MEKADENGARVLEVVVPSQANDTEYVEEIHKIRHDASISWH